MTHFIGIGGQPAAGKTTSMIEILADLGFYDKENQWQDFKHGLMRGHYTGFMQKAATPPGAKVRGITVKTGKLIVLGRYDVEGPFKGTDKLSMGVMGDESWWKLIFDRNNSVCLFEGDRLFNATFLRACADNGNTRSLYWLNTSRDECDKRRAQRGPQNQSWVNGRVTKSENLFSDFGGIMVDQADLEKQIMAELRKLTT
jgi:hypothetical protein